MTLPTDKTPARGALTPGLAALLDTTIERFDDDKRRARFGVKPRSTVGSDQLDLFTQSEDGATWVGFDGATL